MKGSFTILKLHFCFKIFISILFLSVLTCTVFAQTRIYATEQTSGNSGLCAGCVVTNATNAINTNHSDYAGINITLGLVVPPSTYQILIFSSPQKPTAGTPVMVKLGTGDQLLSVGILGAISLQAFNGATPVGSPVFASTLVSTLNNNNQVEVAFAPQQNYDRVKVTLNGGLVSGLSNINLYGAYFNTLGTTACDAAIDELDGISAGLLGLGADVGGVVNPQQAVDGNLGTASTLNAGVGLAGAYAQQTVVFPNVSVLGDSVRLTLSLPQALLDAGVLSNIQILTANGTTNNNDNLNLSSSLLNVHLHWADANGRKVTVTFAPSAVFDRVQLRLGGGIANALSTLKFYEAERLIPRPQLSINGVVANHTSVCAGSTVNLSAATKANTVFRWYNLLNGGTPVFEGNTFSTPALNSTTTYYVEAVRNGCTNASERAAAIINVNPIPDAPVVANSTVNICAGQHAVFTVQNLAGITVNWYTTANGGTAIFTGNTFTTPALTSAATYYAEAVSGSCVSAMRTAVTVNINQAPANFAVTPSTQTKNAGETATFTATSADANAVFNWYNLATGGVSFYTGSTYTTPALSANATYYVEAVSAEGCAATNRIAVTVTVNPINPNPVPCDAAISQNTDIDGLLCVGCTISNPQNAADQSSITFSQLNVAAGLINAYAQQTLRFASTGSAGDSVVVDLGLPANLADVGLLSQIQFATYNGSIYNNDRFSINNTTANIRILTDRSRVRITFKASKDFDRVEIRLNSTAAGLLTALKVFDAAQEVAAPVIASASVNICSGTQTTLTASAANNVTINWYDVATGGTPVYTGANFTTPILSANTTYYAESTRTTSGCVQTVRTPVTVNVNPLPATPAVNADEITVCAGQRASFTVQNLAGETYNWYTAPTGGNAVFTGANFVSDPLTVTTKFYVEAVNGNCISASRKEVTANVTDAVTDPVLAQNSVQTCSGTAATLSASSPQQNVTFNWFDSATATTPIFTGADFTTPVLTSNQSYFVQAVLGDCMSNKVKADVTINPNPDAPAVTVNPANQQITAGQTATLTALSATPGTTFRYYAQATGGLPLFEGATLITPALSSNATFYVEAVSASGCVSITRTAVPITVTPVFSTTCDFASTQTNAIDNLCVGCSITNPENVVDADVRNYARLNIPAGTAGSNITQRLIFTDQGVVGDTVQLLVHVPNAVLSAQVLTGLQLTSYNGATSNNDQINANSNSVGLQILGGGDQALIKFAPQAAFNAIELQLNAGVTSTLTTLDVFYATKQIAIPQLTQVTTTICAGGNAVFTVANPRADVTYDWFDAASGGNLLYTGTTFTTPNLTASTTYYVQSKRSSNGCVNASRVAAVVSVTPTPPVAVAAQNNVTICAGANANLSVTNAGNNTVNWYDAATGGNLIFTGSNFKTASLQNTTDFYAELVNGNCTSSSRADVTVTVNSLPATPKFVNNQVTVCTNSAATLAILNPENNTTYEWFTSASGGNAVFTGINFSTPNLNQNTIYYVQAKSAAGCVNNGDRAAVTVNVSSSINQPVLSSTQNSVCSGGMVTVSVVNPSSALTYNWFDAASGGNIVYTGTSFTVKNITADVSYYVEASNGAGCISSSRKATSITVIAAPAQPSVQSTGLMACQGNVTTLKIQNPQADQIYNWYSTATGGNAVFTGNEFTTPALSTNTVYYVEASSSQNCNPSARLAINVTINPLPAAPDLTAPTVTVCMGDKATFSVSSPVAGVVYRWYDSPAKTNKLFEGSTFVTNPLSANTDFYVDAISASGCVSAGLTVAHAVITAAPDAPLLTNQAATVCAGSVVTFSIANPQPDLTYKWYSAASGGNAVFTGINFTTPAINQNTTFYAEASRNGSCTSATRTAATVTVNAAPAAPVINTQGTTICAGSTTTLTATADANATVKWFGQASGGAELYTGTSFVTPVLTASTTYYAAAVSSANNCTSVMRTAVTVTVGSKLNAPFVSVKSVTINSITFGWNAVSGATGYEISTDNGKTFAAAGNPTLTYTATGLQPAQSVTIIVRAKGAADCQTSANSASVTGKASNPLGNLVWVPNAFTPNGDGANETLRVYGNTIKTLNFNIYSHWGELLFNSTSTSLGWDGTYKGKLQPVGVYVYYVEAVTNDGETVKLKGTINLLR